LAAAVAAAQFLKAFLVLKEKAALGFNKVPAKK